MIEIDHRYPSVTLSSGMSANIEPRGTIGLLSEMAPDGKFRAKFPNAVSFSEIFGDRNEARHRAYELASKLVLDEPVSRGIQQFRIYEEALIDELERIFLLFKLIDWLKANRIQTCELSEQSWLSSFTHILAAENELKVKTSPQSDGRREYNHPLRQRAVRVARRIRQSVFSRSALSQEWGQFLDHIDPYHRRAIFRWRQREWRAGDIWFYTTAHTFTNIGLAYEPYFPAPFNFLVENPIRGGAPLKALSRPWTSVYEFSFVHFSPCQDEVESSRNVIVRHLRSVQLSGSEARAREIILSGTFFAEFCQRLLALGLYYTRLLEEWIERMRPALLVVGNYGFESYALLAARKRGIPTILLQHGTMGADCEISERAVDHYVVYGKFWQGFLPEQARDKSMVLNISDNSGRELPKEPRGSLLFLTAPYSMQRFWTESDLDDILAVLLRCASERGVELIVRVHPLEDMGFYRRRIETLMGEEDSRLITYSRGGNLDSLLVRAAVAVTYSSTVFLDCLRWQVPIVSFDWHDFSYKERIRDQGVFHFAESLAEFEALLLRALSGTLPPFRQSLEPFLASTSAAELAREIERMMGNKHHAGMSHPAQKAEMVAGVDAG